MSVILTICMTGSSGTMPAKCLTPPSSVLGGSKPPLPSPTRAKPSSSRATSKLPPAGPSPRNDCNSSFAALAENEDCRTGLSRQSGMTADDSASHYSTALAYVSFRILPVGRFFIGGSAGTPVALLPHIDVALLDPFARQPDIARMRTRPPMAGHPNPLATPVPLAGNEIPKRRGARRRGNNFFPVRRRRLGGLSDVGAVRRSDLRRNGNGTFDHATRWQQQAHGHQETFGWNGIFHGFKFGTSRANLVHFSENAMD